MSCSSYCTVSLPCESDTFTLLTPNITSSARATLLLKPLRGEKLLLVVGGSRDQNRKLLSLKQVLLNRYWPAFTGGAGGKAVLAFTSMLSGFVGS